MIVHNGCRHCMMPSGFAFSCGATAFSCSACSSNNQNMLRYALFLCSEFQNSSLLFAHAGPSFRIHSAATSRESTAPLAQQAPHNFVHNHAYMCIFAARVAIVRMISLWWLASLQKLESQARRAACCREATRNVAAVEPRPATASKRQADTMSKIPRPRLPSVSALADD